MSRIEKLDSQPGLPIEVTIGIFSDLQTGETTFRSQKRRHRRGTLTDFERAQALKSWWEENGRLAFLQTAQTWQQDQSVGIAEISGQNVEFSSAKMAQAGAEEALRSSFRSTLFKPIQVLAITILLKKEARRIEIRLGEQSGWIASFLSETIDILAEERRVSKRTKSGLKALARRQPFLTGL